MEILYFLPHYIYLTALVTSYFSGQELHEKKGYVYKILEMINWLIDQQKMN